MRRALDPQTLAGSVAVVTGAASGIGFALAESCAMHGMSVVLADVEEEALERATSSMKRRGAEVAARCVDVRVAAEVEALAEHAFASGHPVRLFFNNAGVGLIKPFLETSLEDWRWTLDVNVWGVIHGMRAFLPRLIEQRQQSFVVNTASAAGLLAPSEMSAYSVSKHSVVALSETVQRELSGRSTSVQLAVVCPDLVRTRIHESSRNRPAAATGSAQNQSRNEEEKLRQLGEAMTEAMSAEEASRRVFAGLQEGRFLITTHEQTAEQARRRIEELLGGLVPDSEP